MNIPLFPKSASTFTGTVDGLFFFWFAIALFFAVLVAGFILYFIVTYHHRQEIDRRNPPTFNLMIEIAWTGIPLFIVMGLFLWGTQVFLKERQPPANAEDIWVVGKQWMWKIQHAEGQSEINQMHVPVDRPIRLLMTSQDVIHSFYIPAFRIKQDVLPGRYSTLWFKADKPGTYHLFCSQYCGVSHANMVGEVIVMTPSDYAGWLKETSQPAVLSPIPGTGLLDKVTTSAPMVVAGAPMVEAGAQLFHQMACTTCHHADSEGNGPTLVGVYKSRVELVDGRTVIADEDYLRESILKPNAKIVKGYSPLMPTFEGQVSEDQMVQLLAYIKSLKGN